MLSATIVISYHKVISSTHVEQPDNYVVEEIQLENCDEEIKILTA